MATLTIRNLPDQVCEALKIRAKRNLRSLNQEIVAELMQVAAAETSEEIQARVEREISEIEALRSRMKGFLTSNEIDEAKRPGHG